MAKKMAACEISHNDIGEIDRGVWRKYNPYNPYVEEKDEKVVDNLKVDSLDDLFDDEPINNVQKEENNNNITNQLNNNLKENADIKNKTQIDTLDLNSLQEESPILPQDEDEDEYDLQKELEAKFDELFGPIDDDT